MLDLGRRPSDTRGWGMRRRLRPLTSVLLVLIGPVCIAQAIKIRVVDVRNKHPLPNLHVTLSLLFDKNEKLPPNYNPVLRGETDSDGEAQFGLPQPAPAHFSTWVESPGEHWWVGGPASVETRDVIERGIVGSRPGPWSNKQVTSLKATPGEIIILARPWNLFERILAPLERE